jgi:hypothetical protein
VAVLPLSFTQPATNILPVGFRSAPVPKRSLTLIRIDHPRSTTARGTSPIGSQ